MPTRPCPLPDSPCPIRPARRFIPCAPSRSRRHATILLAATALAAGAVTAPPTAPARAATGDLTADVVVMAAGDIIGTCTSTTTCDFAKVSDAILGAGPDVVLALGDVSNNSGSASDYTGRFQATWGRFLAAVAPVPGNHDYGATNAVNYFTYFGSAAHGPDGYYSLDLGNWHVLALNSNCAKVGGCQKDSPQEKWLRAELTDRPRPCTLAFWHHPRYSSGYGGDNTATADLYADLFAAGADVLLSGHSHDYERFAQQNAAGGADPAGGVRQFVVGTGGAFFTGFSTIEPNSQAHQNTAMGALKLTLHPGSYDWAFQPIAGKTYSDTGKATCHRAAAGDDTSAPSAPGSLRATSVTSTSVSLAWTAGTDDVGVIGYRVVRDLVPPASGTVTATTSATTWTDKDLSPATTYGYQVRAVDAAGNQSAPATLVVATPAAPPAPATVTFAPVDDATVDQSRPTTNLGTSTRLVADHSPVNDALMRFVVSGLGGCTVANATLRLTVGSSSDDGSGQGGDVHGAGAAVWSQSTLTWNSAPAAGPALGSIGAVKIGATYAVDVTGSVAGDGPVGFRVTNTSSDGARYYSTEGSATKGPRLTVTCA